MGDNRCNVPCAPLSLEYILGHRRSFTFNNGAMPLTDCSTDSHTGQGHCRRQEKDSEEITFFGDAEDVEIWNTSIFNQSMVLIPGIFTSIAMPFIKVRIGNM